MVRRIRWIRQHFTKFKLSLDNEVIKSCGEILAQHLIDYIKKGGDVNNLTPINLLKKNKNLNY